MKPLVRRTHRVCPSPPARRSVARTWGLLLSLAAACWTREARGEVGTNGARSPGAAQVDAVGEIGTTVADLDRAVTFYRDVLGAVVLGEEEREGPAEEATWGVFGARRRTAHLRLGAERLALTEFLAPRGRAIPAEQRSHDGGFQHIAIVVADMDAGYRWLRNHRVAHVSSGPQTLPAWNTAAAGIRAFYFADPDRHTLELIWFPAGKGEPRWHLPAAARPGTVTGTPGPRDLFLGIDHTAIGVRDTEASLRLYRDGLGLRVAGTSENYGTEQEHLNNVFGAHLRITTLRATSGPGIELLQYLAPTDGRPAPPDLKASDLLHWHTTLQVKRLPAALGTALQAGAWRVSASEPPARPGGRGAPPTLVRDADAHGLLFVENGREERP